MSSRSEAQSCFLEALYFRSEVLSCWLGAPSFDCCLKLCLAAIELLLGLLVGRPAELWLEALKSVAIQLELRLEALKSVAIQLELRLEALKSVAIQLELRLAVVMKKAPLVEQKK